MCIKSRFWFCLFHFSSRDDLNYADWNKGGVRRSVLYKARTKNHFFYLPLKIFTVKSKSKVMCNLIWCSNTIAYKPIRFIERIIIFMCCLTFVFIQNSNSNNLLIHWMEYHCDRVSEREREKERAANAARTAVIRNDK